ncbi:BZ3500_MvSof-1268-A1-R1_Chr10-1g02740 [Microbotryum saponariae]|uniref:BZ3500_MvSof-1268-A1-R1_Chr10-1g02740 protein n=1 Tax=Microbotryum saponariae TaxID=289078 RepID=A0A2X0LK29_9BASI|nr:BZ3500_MvSof-1268-A1-R1_Chr10-1g02740 [Microbotryum saponariae]SDA06229.1 BZ3501_MvSof-1269-A2-R1_Chr10-1g02341 [Microbotryum saponariae]
MAFGTLYGFPGNPRTNAALVTAQYEGIDLDFVDVHPFAEGGIDAAYKAKFPLGLVPGLEVGSLLLSETLAISTYLASQSNKANLFGSTKEETAIVYQWASWANQEFLPKLGSWFAPLLGMVPYNKKAVDDAKAVVLARGDYLEKALANKTFLATERITIADILLAAVLARGFERVLDAEYRAARPNTMRYFKTVVHQPEFQTVLKGEPTLCEKAVQYTPPKKEAKPAAAAAAPAPKAKAAPKPKDAEEDEPSAPSEPKAKHPCEALGPAKSFPLDEWKRQYSNNDTPVAFEWLEKNFDAQEYSLWKCEFKYPDELTQVFMSSNLITGFHSRLEGSRKYVFGSTGVYGTNNNSKIVGVYLIRGSDYKGVFDVAPDYESYEFTPLDLKNDRDFILGCWAWTNTYKGLEYADGKVMK